MKVKPRKTNTFQDIPFLSEQLLKALENRFPPRCPQMNESEREIFEYTGRVNLLAWLRNVQRAQFEAAKEQSVSVLTK
jgi:hypothetical protein